MITKLRQNYNLCNILSKFLFAVAFTFAKWSDISAASLAVVEYADAYVVALAGFLLGLIVAFVLPFLINYALNFARIHSVPRAEYVLIAVLFFALNYILCGLLSLFGMFSPIVAVWGAVIFYVIAGAVSMLLFYTATSKLYFNEVTRVYYFKVIAIAYFVLMVVGGYLL